MRGQEGHDLLADGGQVVVELCAGDHEKDVADVRKHLPRSVVGLDNVPEAGFVPVGNDGVDLGLLYGHRPLESGQVVLGGNPVERRHAIGGRPRFKEGIGTLFLFGFAGIGRHTRNRYG